MLKKFILNSLALAVLNGCGAPSFPQYSGHYRLSSYSYSDESFRGSMNLPSELDLVDRMEFCSGYWKHYLSFDFVNRTKDEANAKIILTLNKIIKKNDYVYPNDAPDGTELWSESEVNGGAFCYFQYKYYLYMQTVPDATILNKVYSTHGSYVYIDPLTGMEIAERLTDPENAKIKDNAYNEWYDGIRDNQGITIILKLSRVIDSDLTGCNENSYLVYDDENRNNADLIMVYSSTFIDQSVDIRKTGLEEIFEDYNASKEFFRKIVSGVK